MPELMLPCVRGTLIGETVHTVIDRQIAYGDELGIPWGVSESCFAITDAHQTYQYRAFGVPGLGLMRGLADDRVVAPYATLLCLAFAPDAAAANVERLIGMGMLGTYGFYDAIDFTPARVPPGEAHVIVRTFMAHHQGMGLVALTNALGSFAMVRRFLSHPEMRATEQLVHERVPKVAPIYPHPAEVAGTVRASAAEAETLRIFTTPDTPFPEVQLLSNGRLHVMVTAAGGGYVRWKDLAVTRWHEDATRDGWGPACYVRDVSSERVWSVTHHPSLATSAAYEAVFLEGRAEFRRSDEDVQTQLEIGVSPEDDVEVRRVRLTNRGRTRRTLEVTSYLEVVLAPPTSDAVHPAFSNLFVETEILRPRSAILATRRKRAPAEQPPWLVHRVTTRAADEDVSFETDRAAFIGRNRSLADPEALHRRVLSGQEGAVLDPCAAIRRTIVLGADETATIDFVTGIAETREAALALCEKYESKRLTDRVLELSWTHAHVTLRELDATDAEAQLYGRLAGAILYANPIRRAPSSLIARNRRGQSGLWGYGISGDLPIVLLRIGDQQKLALLRELVRAHAWWRLKGLAVDLVVWNEDQSGYRQALHDQIVAIVSAGPEAHVLDRTGGIFVRRADQISDEDKLLLQSTARVSLADSDGTLAEQLDSRGRGERRQVPRFIPTGSRSAAPPAAAASQGSELLLFNGLGGFSKDGREYVIELPPGVSTPLPWSNVIANPFGGTVVTESGAAYTWAENAHELRLTPWYNDPIQDASGEAFYLRDDESGHAWSPSPFPARAAHTYTVRHGLGYSVFELEEAGIRSELTVFVARDAPVKLFVLRLENRSGRTRGLSVFGMVEWVLGEQRSRCASQVVTEIDGATGAILARNPLNHEFPRRTAFFDVSERARTVTGSRTEFLGRNSTLVRPDAMRRVRLSNRVGAGLDPCGAIQTAVELEDGADREITFVLGAGKDIDEARAHLARYRSPHVTARSLAEVMHQWRRLTGALQVETPDPTLDLLVNGWLPYQVQGARIWGRSGYYQSGGAYGFRDQLQDVLALLHHDPRIAREQIVRAARHQFVEGDVQHWWHPPIGRGVRTRISDDYLWLPYAVALYVEHTGDQALLDELAPLLAGRPLNPDEESYYDLPARSEESCSIYEHCVRAIRHGLRFGEQGLPLIGSGDWNDGMNLVGIQGKGESVWLAFFLADVLTRFAVLADARSDAEFVELCKRTTSALRDAIETHAWDGAWYRRATFDDGTPLGTATADECRIDCLPQSWAVLTGLVDPQRARQAMQSVDENLVRRDAGIVQLLTPPFEHSSHNPGYIQGYVPGVRENGGQYTHAAVWTAMAFAALGDRERAWELFRMLNPLSGRDVQTYKVEPYVVAADVYANPQHVGRGGWTWYTGSAGWMLRFVLESLLGIRRQGHVLTFAPLFPEGWTRFRVHYRFEETLHHITVENRGGREATRITVDGVLQRTAVLALASDGAEHEVVVECGPSVV
jgi:cellobiose phosphorylase